MDGGTGSKEQQDRIRAKATGDLDRVTDYVEEREMDATKVADRMRAMLGSTSGACSREESERTRVKIQQNDVMKIVDELDVDVRVAEKALREYRGDVVAATCALVREEVKL